MYMCIHMYCINIYIGYISPIKFIISEFHAKLRYSFDLKAKGSLWEKMGHLDHEILETQSHRTMNQKKFKQMD